MLMRRLLMPSLMLLAGVSFAQTDVLVTVNGRSVKKEDVLNRLWTLHASEVLNLMVDEIVAEQALQKFESDAPKKDKDAWKKEAEARLKNIKEQFKGEQAFNENLQKSGITLASLRQQIDQQLLREKLVISAKNVSVSPGEVKQFYEANKDKIGNQESVRLRHVQVGSEQQAKDILVAIRVGADFAKLAQELSLDAATKERGGDLGFIGRGMLAPEIEKMTFSLKPGMVSEVVRTPLGFHVFKVEERRAAKPTTFNDVEKDLARAVLAQKINQAWTTYIQELRASSKIVTSPGVGTR